VIKSEEIKGTGYDIDSCENILYLNEDDEQIILVEGYFDGEIITRIYLLTNHGKYIECGGKKGTKFNWKFEGGQYFIGLKACLQKYICFLTPLWLDRIPSEKSKELKLVKQPNLDIPCIFYL